MIRCVDILDQEMKIVFTREDKIVTRHDKQIAVLSTMTIILLGSLILTCFLIYKDLYL